MLNIKFTELVDSDGNVVTPEQLKELIDGHGANVVNLITPEHNSDDVPFIVAKGIVRTK